MGNMSVQGSQGGDQVFTSVRTLTPQSQQHDDAATWGGMPIQEVTQEKMTAAGPQLTYYG